MSATTATTGDFKCSTCDARTAALPVRGFRTSDAFDAWFRMQGWDVTSGKPVCKACKALPPPAPPAPSSGVRRVCVNSAEIIDALAETVAQPTSKKPLDVLGDVAARLSPFGEVKIVPSLKTLFLDGESVVMVNASDALVLCQVVRGSERVAPAENVAKGASAADIAAMVLARVAKGGRRAA